MKLEIYNEVKLTEERLIRLKLVQYSNGNIVVQAVDKNGKRLNQGDLITFQNNGKIYRSICVNNDLGFQLNNKGCIKVEDS